MAGKNKRPLVGDRLLVPGYVQFSGPMLQVLSRLRDPRNGIKNSSFMPTSTPDPDISSLVVAWNFLHKFQLLIPLAGHRKPSFFVYVCSNSRSILRDHLNNEVSLPRYLSQIVSVCTNFSL